MDRRKEGVIMMTREEVLNNLLKDAEQADVAMIGVVPTDDGPRLLLILRLEEKTWWAHLSAEHSSHIINECVDAWSGVTAAREQGH